MQLFSQEQAIILIQLLIAHLLADFVFQLDSWVNDKKEKGIKSWGFVVHILVVGLLTWVSIWKYPLFALAITVVHALVDAWKGYAEKQNDQKPAAEQKTVLYYFLLDQLLHIITIAMAWLFMISGWTQLVQVTVGLWNSFEFLLVALGYVFCIWPTSYLIRFATKDLITQANDGNVKKGGRLIGMFERVIIFTLVLLGQYEAIGFLITGKSILRFANEQKIETEYLLVGTMMSYAMAILTGSLVNLLIPG